MMELPFLSTEIDLNGDWKEKEQLLYDIFRKDFLEVGVFFQSIRVICDARPSDGGKESGFWHLITREEYDAEGNRLVDFARAKRLHWVKPIIENHANPGIKHWNYLEGSGRVRKYLWVVGYCFVVILERHPRKPLYVLVTAFCVGEKKRQDLERRYDKRIL